MMEIFFNPSLPSRWLTATGLNISTVVTIANFEDCYLTVQGGINATSPDFTAEDAFLVGGFDFADGFIDLIDEFAEAGNVSTIAACRTLNGCQVANYAGVVREGYGFIFCVGGSALGALGM